MPRVWATVQAPRKAETQWNMSNSKKIKVVGLIKSCLVMLIYHDLSINSFALQGACSPSGWSTSVTSLVSATAALRQVANMGTAWWSSWARGDVTCGRCPNLATTCNTYWEHLKSHNGLWETEHICIGLALIHRRTSQYDAILWSMIQFSFRLRWQKTSVHRFHLL